MATRSGSGKRTRNSGRSGNSRSGSNRSGRSGGGEDSGGLEKLGALWLGESRQGVKYMSGEIEGIGRVVVFKNGFKEESKHPDYIIYLSQDREEAETEDKGDDAPPF